MSDKTFELLEKLYAEFSGFKNEVNQRLYDLNEKYEGLNEKYEGLNEKYEGLNEKYEGLNEKYEGLNEKYEGLNEKYEGLNKKVDKNTLLLERMDYKLQLLAEVQQNHFEINERQHEEMMKATKEQVELLKTALKHVIHT
ncbi:MAG TPA: hypothetical protein GXX14_14045 [Clostridiaceae bacterium]|nr:hypothetical protein [Clostridiaceae bacterium]